MIDRNHDLPSFVRKARALNISRASVYQPRPVSAEDLALMRRVDEMHLEYPFAGSRMLRGPSHREGVEDRPPHRHADDRMGVEATYH